MRVQIYKARQQDLAGESLYTDRCKALTGFCCRQHRDDSIITYGDGVFSECDAGWFNRNQPFRFE